MSDFYSGNYGFSGPGYLIFLFVLLFVVGFIGGYLISYLYTITRGKDEKNKTRIPGL